MIKYSGISLFKFLPFVVATGQVLSLKTFAQLEKDLILIAYDSEYTTTVLTQAVLHTKNEKNISHCDSCRRCSVY